MTTQKKPDEMTEKELAQFYEERKDDESLWEKKPAKIRVRRGGPSTVFSLRLAPEELEELSKVAEANGVNLSDFIRSAALKEAREGKVLADPPAILSVRAPEPVDLADALKDQFNTMSLIMEQLSLKLKQQVELEIEIDTEDDAAKESRSITQ